MKPIEEQGYVILALNTPQVDYLDCARTLTKTIKQWNPHASVCLITDQTHANDPLYNHYRVIDNVDRNNLYANDWQVFFQTPYRETIKLEADMIVTSAIDHWWTLFELRDVVISQGCRNFYDEPADSRFYRKIFDQNHLPDVYNAITYWRLSKTARDFFDLIRNIFEHWNDYRTLLKFSDDTASTDVVYAMAAQIMGPEQVTLPGGLGPSIVHMKRHINPIQSNDWTKELVWENDPFRINTVSQWGMVHYHIKGWANEQRPRQI